MIQWKKEESDTITVRGNFKQRGKYSNVVLIKNTVLNLYDLNDVPEFSEPYFCPKCMKRHLSGKIFEKHKKYIRIKENEDIPFDKILHYNPRKIRDVAYKQIQILKRKLKNAKGVWRDVYKREINRVILDEKSRREN